MRIQAHPHYAEGFWDATQGEPLFPDASPEYRAGWEALWKCKEILAAGFDRPPARAECAP